MIKLKAGHVIHARNAWGVVIGEAGMHVQVRWGAIETPQYCTFLPHEIGVVLDLGRTPGTDELRWLRTCLFCYEYSRYRANSMFLRIVWDPEAKALLDLLRGQDMSLETAYEKYAPVGLYGRFEDSLRILIENGYLLHSVNNINGVPDVEIYGAYGDADGH